MRNPVATTLRPGRSSRPKPAAPGSLSRCRLASYGNTNNRILGLTENAAALRSYTYDNSGNILTDTRPGDVFAFTYNKRNRPVSVTRNSVTYATYGYNANEQLVSRSTADRAGHWARCTTSTISRAT